MKTLAKSRVDFILIETLENLRAAGYLEDFYDLELGIRDYYSYLEKGGYIDD